MDRTKTILDPCDVSFCNNGRVPPTPRTRLGLARSQKVGVEVRQGNSPSVPGPRRQKSGVGAVRDGAGRLAGPGRRAVEDGPQLHHVLLEVAGDESLDGGRDGQLTASRV